MDFGSLACFFFVSLLLTSYTTEAAKSDSSLCLKRSLTDIASLEGDLCYPHLHEDNCTPRVLQVGGRNINKALSLYRKGDYEYTALLFYAEWCPFSRAMRKMFDTLSILFPAVSHIAVESSALWPSELSEHGVRSLPALFVHNKTLRFQFYGARSMEKVTEFYVAKTGFVPISLSYTFKEANTIPRRQENKEWSWRNWLTFWLRDDFYLAFSVLFLMLRSFLYIQPKIVAGLRTFWNLKEASLKAPKAISRQVNAEQLKRVASVVGEKGKGKHLRKEDKECGKGVLSVPSWPSSSLAAVALAECSSRGVATDDPTKKSTSGGLMNV